MIAIFIPILQEEPYDSCFSVNSNLVFGILKVSKRVLGIWNDG